MVSAVSPDLLITLKSVRLASSRPSSALLARAGELGLEPRQLLGGEPARPHRRGEEPVQVDPDRHALPPATAPVVRHRAAGCSWRRPGGSRCGLFARRPRALSSPAV